LPSVGATIRHGHRDSSPHDRRVRLRGWRARLVDARLQRIRFERFGARNAVRRKGNGFETAPSTIFHRCSAGAGSAGAAAVTDRRRGPTDVARSLATLWPARRRRRHSHRRAAGGGIVPPHLVTI